MSGGLLVVSVRPDREPPPVERVDRAVQRYLVPPGSDPRSTVRADAGYLTIAAPEPADLLPDAAGGFTVRLVRAVRGPTADVGTGRLAAMLSDASAVDAAALSELLPPFAAAHRAHAEAPLVVAGDWLGHRHLFWWQGDGVAAVSTSALAIGVIAESRVDPAALGIQSLLGWQVGPGTLLTGVSKLPPGSVAVLRAGRVEIIRYARALSHVPAPEAPEQIVSEMAGRLREILHSYVTDHPDAVLQLSGGQDSRLILCAIPPHLRSGMAALTLDVTGGVEEPVARRLSHACGLSHQTHWLDHRPPADRERGYHAALGAVPDLNAMASPLALGALALIEADLGQGRRLSGTGGETARGFYYPGQPRTATTSPRLVERLADWRLTTNEAVQQDALDPGFAAAARAATMTALAECFAQYSSDWNRATDEFYLWQRVQRWAGAHDTAAATSRELVNPLLDRRFIALALASHPALRRGSRLTSRVIHRLDPGLAAVPLDSGLVPAQVAHGGVRARAVAARVTGQKAAAKISQHLRRQRRPQPGAAVLASHVVESWRRSPEALDPVRGSGVLRERWLDELVGGRRSAEPTTVAFLLNLLAATEVAATSTT